MCQKHRQRCRPCGGGGGPASASITSYGCPLYGGGLGVIPGIAVTLNGPGGAVVTTTTGPTGNVIVSLPSAGSWTAVGAYPCPFAGSVSMAFTAVAGLNRVALMPTPASGYVCPGFDAWPWPARTINVTDNFGAQPPLVYYPASSRGPGVLWPYWSNGNGRDPATGIITSPSPWIINPGLGGVMCGGAGFYPWAWAYAADAIPNYVTNSGGGLQIGSFWYACGPNDPGQGGASYTNFRPVSQSGSYCPFALTFTFQINGTYNSGYVYNGAGTVTLT